MKNKLYQLMNTKTLMIISAIFLAVNGFGFTFFPDEITRLLINDDNYILILILQILGALYLGFSILNWTAKASLIGGIYNKPILIGNLLHFFTASMTLIKLNQGFQDNQLIFSYTIIYSLFTLSFGYVFFTNPSLK
jgi:Fe2+ transport system protein B